MLTALLQDPDHPRASGEHSVAPGLSVGELGCGSSPRERGTHIERRAQLQISRQRIIPARAGNTLPCKCLVSNAFENVKERTEEIEAQSSV